MSIDRGIATPINNATAFRCDFEPVAMAPYATHVCGAIATAWFSAVSCGVHLKIARKVTRVVFVIPKVQRHRRQRLRTRQLAHFSHDGLPLFIPSLYSAAQQATLHLTHTRRQLSVAANECPREICTARDIAPPDVGA